MEMGLLYKMVLIDLGLFNMDYESFFFLCCNMLNMVGVWFNLIKFFGYMIFIYYWLI